jgi:hypothetical protein
MKHPSDALWFFCGEHPSGFSTSGTLRSSGGTDPTKLTWSITGGADKVEFAGPATGAEVNVNSKKGSATTDDVSIKVQDGAASHTGKLTVRKPHLLLAREVIDQGSCPRWATGCTLPAFWSQLDYRIVDNVGGTIIGATVNENFPSAKVNDQANNWSSPADFISSPTWPNTDGTFVDDWAHWGGTPPSVTPTEPNAGEKVDHMAHEFFVGGPTPGKGCRVQKHTAQRFRGMARHEGIVSPAP